MDAHKLDLTEYPWIPFESRWCAQRVFPHHSTALRGQAVFLTRLSGTDYRHAEALLLDGDSEPFQKVKTLLARGNIDRAKAEISTFNVKSIDAEIELNLEKARLAAYEGDWQMSASICSEALKGNLPGVTRLTFLQVRSLACLELGLYSQAAQDLESMDSMRTIYPHAPVFNYLDALRIRLGARLGHVKKARNLMTQAWQEARTSHLDLDLLLTLLRTEVDLRLLTREDARAHAVASLSVAEALGDRLYAALARIDILRSGAANADLMDTLDRDAAEYKKVRKFLARFSMDAVEIADNQTNVYRTLFFSEIDLLVNLKPFMAFNLNAEERLTKVISALASSSLTKESLFIKAWGISKYVPYRHENLIDQTISRIRKKFKLNLQRESGFIRIDELLRL